MVWQRKEETVSGQREGHRVSLHHHKPVWQRGKGVVAWGKGGVRGGDTGIGHWGHVQGQEIAG